MGSQKRNLQFYIPKLGKFDEAVDACVKRHQKFIDDLRQNRYQASNLPVSRRVLSHWRSFSLLDPFDNNPEQLQVSYIAIFWLLIVAELRDFGLSLEKISEVKKALFYDYGGVSVLEYHFILWRLNKSEDFFVIISGSGRAAAGSQREIDLSEAFGFLEESYIKINLNSIENRIGDRSVKVFKKSFKDVAIGGVEAKILRLIKGGEYKEIVLKFNNGVITHISKKLISQNPNPLEEIRKHIKSNDGFCNISLKKVDGKFVSLEVDIMQKT